ncbi:hypothetical protein EDD85DRAFT_983311 [Armillaria nabsnona]|nr:hypothetical protein EDD85DRAFT_983311 [Armillaria nabsnona]
MYVWPLYVLYPTCKCWMYLAPIPLGLMFNIGIYMGWADLAPDGVISYCALTAAYLGATMWTIMYKGMKSLAILCGRHTIQICSATTVGFTALTSWVAFMLLKELIVMDIDKPKQCMKFFLHIPTIGNLILAGLVVDAIVQRVIEGIPL